MWFLGPPQAPTPPQAPPALVKRVETAEMKYATAYKRAVSENRPLIVLLNCSGTYPGCVVITLVEFRGLTKGAMVGIPDGKGKLNRHDFDRMPLPQEIRELRNPPPP